MPKIEDEKLMMIFLSIFQVDVHSVTCPGVWFPCKSPVYMSLCFLGFHVKTKPFPAAFPLLFGDKFVFEKTFPGIE